MAGAVLLLHVTSLVESDPHQDLLQEKGGRGFPYLAVLDPEGNVLAKPSSREVDAFERLIGKAAQYLELVKKADAGGESAAFDLFLSRLQLGIPTYKEAVAEKKKQRNLSDDQKELVEMALLELRVVETCAGMKTNKDRVSAGSLFFKLSRKKLVPRDSDVAGPFWEQITYFAEKQKNAKVFRDAMEQFAASATEGSTKDRVLEAMQARLQKLRS